jgi:hypothetical protein
MLVYYMLMLVLYFIYLLLITTGIGHGLARVYLCSNKDRSLSCLRHPFGYVTFPFISSRMVSVYWQIAFYSYVSSRLAL